MKIFIWFLNLHLKIITCFYIKYYKNNIQLKKALRSMCKGTLASFLLPLPVECGPHVCFYPTIVWIPSFDLISFLWSAGTYHQGHGDTVSVSYRRDTHGGLNSFFRSFWYLAGLYMNLWQRASWLEIIGIESMFVEWVNEWISGQLLAL